MRRGCDAYRIEVGAGDMVLWRSDLAHSNAQPLVGQRRFRSRFRAVSYVCMLPAALTREVLPILLLPKKYYLLILVYFSLCPVPPLLLL